MGTKAPKDDEILVKVVAKPPNPDEVEVEEVVEVEDDLNVPDMDMGELGDLIEIRSEEDVRNAMVVGELRGLPWAQARNRPLSELYAMADYVAHLLQ